MIWLERYRSPRRVAELAHHLRCAKRSIELVETVDRPRRGELCLAYRELAVVHEQLADLATTGELRAEHMAAARRARNHARRHTFARWTHGLRNG